MPLPERVPEVAWRQGVDLNPLDVTDPDTAAWLTALVWGGHTDREERLQAALRVAAVDPPPVLAWGHPRHDRATGREPPQLTRPSCSSTRR